MNGIPMILETDVPNEDWSDEIKLLYSFIGTEENNKDAASAAAAAATTTTTTTTTTSSSTK
jgi:hypothetical protein